MNDSFTNIDSDSFENIPWAHESESGAGWTYRDEPYGGFLIVGFTECGVNHPDTGEEVSVPLAACVEFINLEDAVGGDETGFLVSANLVVSPEALSDKNRDKVASSCGWYDDDGEPVVDYYSVSSYGLQAPLAHEWGAESWEAGFEAIYDDVIAFSALSGFALDRPWNRLGTTGWDIVMDACFDEDAFDKSFDRLRKLFGDGDTPEEAA